MRDDRVRFARRSAFDVELRKRVDQYFSEQGKATDGGRALLVKTAILFGWLAVSLGAFLVVGGLGAAIVCGISAGLAMGGLGMSVQHDGGHGAYSANGRVNQLAAAVLDLLGASSWFWRVKHRQLHHTYPNIDGADDDIDLGPFLRMAPGQPRRAYHRFQQVYAFALYGVFGLKWFLWDDFAQFARQRIGSRPLARPRGGDAWLFWGGKLAYLTWAIVVPVAVHGWLAGLAFLLASQLTMGVVLSVIFQLAHCVEEASIIDPAQTPGGIELDYAAHQLDTTVDFGRDNRWLGWYCGGLNYQAVHHLFPRVSHVHYPALSLVLERACLDFGVLYKRSASLRESVRSHIRWLTRMGREGCPQEIIASSR
jgi:linoleoyl-CoA desaturase